MKYLTVEQVLFIHARLIEETGGSHGIRDLGLLESAVSRPQATFDKKDLHSGLYNKAAALFHAIIKNHPFVDGNKRTGATTVGIFLLINNYRVTASNKALESFTLKITNSEEEVPAIAEWIKTNSESMKHGK